VLPGAKNQLWARAPITAHAHIPRIDSRGPNRLPNGVTALLVQDTEAVFAAACVNVQAGYFGDPPDLQGELQDAPLRQRLALRCAALSSLRHPSNVLTMQIASCCVLLRPNACMRGAHGHSARLPTAGLAHFLEHAVHLGSAKFPDEKDYKLFLSQHGGSSNASTSKHHPCGKEVPVCACRAPGSCPPGPARLGAAVAATAPATARRRHGAHAVPFQGAPHGV